MGEGHRKKYEQLDAQANRHELRDIGWTSECPGVRLVQPKEPDVVNEISERDGGDPGGDAREHDSRIVHPRIVVGLWSDQSSSSVTGSSTTLSPAYC